MPSRPIRDQIKTRVQDLIDERGTRDRCPAVPDPGLGMPGRTQLVEAVCRLEQAMIVVW
jgi:hypothetical protein